MIDHKKTATAWLSFIGSIIAVLMSVMDIQITNAAIGTIQSAMHFPLEKGSWLSSAYLMAEIVTLPLSGLLLKALGIKRYALVFCMMFMGSSILCAQAWSFSSLIVFRILQGAAGGALMALAYNIIIIKLPTSAHAKANTLFGATVALAPTIGPMIAGVMTESFGWQSLFYINLPIGILALGLMMAGLREDVVRAHEKIQIDFLGLITIVIGLGCLQFVLEEGHSYGWFASAFISTLFITALCALTLFVMNALRVQAPLVNLFLLKNHQLSISCMANLLTGAALFGCYFLVPYFLITLKSYSPVEISYIIFFGGLAQLAALMCMPMILKKINIYGLIAIGSVLFALSSITWSYIAIDFHYEWVIIAQILRGLGGTLMLTPLGILATTSIQKIDAASASILFNVSRTLGGALGVAVLTTLVKHQQTHYYTTLTGTVERASATVDFLKHQSYQLAFRDTFQLLCLFLLLSACAFGILRVNEHFNWRRK
ncbi:DHA2 family efflux MFS transporter permease subunit [Glaciimonas sp. GG7]